MADFSGAKFSGEVNFYSAKFSGEAYFSGAKFSEGVSFSYAKFSGGTYFSGAKFLRGASFSGAKFSGEVNFVNAEFSRGARFSVATFLGGAGFSGAKFLGRASFINATFLGEVYFSYAKFPGGTYFSGATFLRGADFSVATFLGGAGFSGATFLRGADFSGAKFSGKINFLNAEFSEGASFSGADLHDTDLSKANLSGADLSEANLKDCLLWNVRGFPLNYEPKAGSNPYIPSIAGLSNLSKLTYKKSPHGLVDLREGFKKFGYRKQERAITYAIKHTQRRKLWEGRSILDKFEGLFYFIFFELTCKYGMNPGKPLIILVCLIPFFSFLYIFALKTKRQKTGIWLIFLRERVLKTTEKERPFKLSSRFPPRALPTEKISKIKLKILLWYRMIRIALYFSLISAFSIGWRELNVGNWITRLQRREYILKPTGWVRTVSGIQSLISVYLLALWVLTYFGRPFEAV